jgi:hypothetical protein
VLPHLMACDAEAKLRTACGLSCLWDGVMAKRAHGAEGVTILPDRRVALHLMAQPDVAAMMFELITVGIASNNDWITAAWLAEIGLVDQVVADQVPP